jgi:N-methylhydantoinase B/oxoprolinase/acetone carboxylase alpha subunit
MKMPNPHTTMVHDVLFGIGILAIGVVLGYITGLGHGIDLASIKTASASSQSTTLEKEEGISMRQVEGTTSQPVP